MHAKYTGRSQNTGACLFLVPAADSSSGSDGSSGSDSSSGLVFAEKLSGHKSFLLALAFSAKKRRVFLAVLLLFSVLSTEMAVFAPLEVKQR